MIESHVGWWAVVVVMATCGSTTATIPTLGQDLKANEDVATLSGCRRHLQGAFWAVLGRFRRVLEGAFDAAKHGF